MAKVLDLDEKKWAKWVAKCPTDVKAMCLKWPPDRLYRMTDTGQRCTMLSYGEDGTVSVSVTGAHNCTMFDLEVFGVDPNELEECDLPASDEPIGTMLTKKADIDAYVDVIRPIILADRDADHQS